VCVCAEGVEGVERVGVEEKLGVRLDLSQDARLH
jgi:hypothetical protein